MNDLEDRLKDAYASAASTVSPENIRRLDEQSVVITWPAAKSPRPARRWAIPLTTAAVLAIVAASTLPSILKSGHGSQTPLSSAGERFVSAFTPNSQKFFIVDLSTGAKIATVAPPDPDAIFRAAATGNGVNYLTAVARNGGCRTSIYQFKLNSAGTPSRLTPLPHGYLNQKVTELGVSADGSTYAYVASRCGSTNGASREDLTVVNPWSGQSVQYSLPGRPDIGPLSLSSDGSLLTFSADRLNGVASGIYLVNNLSSAGPVRHNPLINGAEFGRNAEVGQPQISPNGRVVYFTSSTGSVESPAEQVRSINVHTGKLRLIAKTSYGFFVLTADPSVRRAILKIQADLAEPISSMINFRTGKITKLKSSFYVPGFGYYIW